MCGGGEEGVADRMQTCGFPLGRLVGETYQRQHSQNALSVAEPPEEIRLKCTNHHRKAIRFNSHLNWKTTAVPRVKSQ
jgi:hypothetical protein